MKKKLTLFLILFSLFGCLTPLEAKTKKETFTVFQLNLWHQGAKVPDGYKAILDVVDEVDADVVFLCEIKDYKDNKFITRLLKDLAARGKVYYGDNQGLPVAIISKHKLDETAH